jgi:hypothetical protein
MKKPLQIMLDPALRAWLRLEADRLGITMAGVVRMLLLERQRAQDVR